jgi:hypothetical protein
MLEIIRAYAKQLKANANIDIEPAEQVGEALVSYEHKRFAGVTDRKITTAYITPTDPATLARKTDSEYEIKIPLKIVAAALDSENIAQTILHAVINTQNANTPKNYAILAVIPTSLEYRTHQIIQTTSAKLKLAQLHLNIIARYDASCDFTPECPPCL